MATDRIENAEFVRDFTGFCGTPRPVLLLWLGPEGQSGIEGVMTGRIRRALCAAAGSLALAGGVSFAAPSVLPFEPLATTLPAPLTADPALPDLSVGAPAPVAQPAPSDLTASSATQIAGLDLEAGYHVDLSGRVALVDGGARAFDGLFLSQSSAAMPYVSLASGGTFAAASAPITDHVRFNAGLESLAAGTLAPTDVAGAFARLTGDPQPYQPRSAAAMVASLSWDASKWASFGLLAAQSSEQNGVLGLAAPGTNTNTTALGVSARVRFGGGWAATATYSEGVSQLDLKPGFAPSLSTDSLHTRSYGIAIAKNGLFGNDTLGIAFSQPALGADDGGFNIVPGATDSSAFFARNHLLQQTGAAQETDVEVGYITTFLDGSLALQTNAAFQMNYAGQNGQNAVSLLSRARIKF